MIDREADRGRRRRPEMASERCPACGSNSREFGVESMKVQTLGVAEKDGGTLVGTYVACKHPWHKEAVDG